MSPSAYEHAVPQRFAFVEIENVRYCVPGPHVAEHVLHPLHAPLQLMVFVLHAQSQCPTYPPFPQTLYVVEHDEHAKQYGLSVDFEHVDDNWPMPQFAGQMAPTVHALVRIATVVNAKIPTKSRCVEHIYSTLNDVKKVGLYSRLFMVTI